MKNHSALVKKYYWNPVRLVRGRSGARAFARFNAHDGELMEMARLLPSDTLKRRKRRAPILPNAYCLALRFSTLLAALAVCIFTTNVVGAPTPETFQNPINSGPDPYLEFYDGNYYLATTQGDCIRLWKAKSLGQLKQAKPVVVWKDIDPSRSRGIWAPEFHFITNHWYIYYTATSHDGKDDNHRLHVIESAGSDPLGPYTYKGRLINPTNDIYAIDASVFKNPGDGSWYAIWAARPGHVLTIAPLANPWTVRTNGAVIPASGFGCEEVREGPIVLQRDGRLFLIYSACDTGKPDYMLGMLTASTNADLMNPASWKQFPQPVFARNDDAGVFGPGHNGFFKAADGTDWIVYHAKTSSQYTYRGRTTRVQPFTWNADGTPDFGKPLPLSAVLVEPVSP